jgi:hypothetical protein
MLDILFYGASGHETQDLVVALTLPSGLRAI